MGWFERHALGAEIALSLLATGALIGWVTFADGQATLEDTVGPDRSTIYATTASVAGALLGFFITTVTIVQGLTTTRAFVRLRSSSQYPALWRVFRRAIRGLALTAVLSLGALFVAHGEGEGWPVFYVVFGCIVLSALLVGQGIWILERVLEISVANPNDGR